MVFHTRTIKFSLIFTWLLTVARCTTVPNLSPSDIETLHELYNATKGQYWTWPKSTVQWDFSGSPNPCSEKWYGVTCATSGSSTTSYIEKLNLFELNLTGTIPSAVAQLPDILGLYLGNNHLSGPVPVDLSYTMTTLDLSGNSLQYDQTTPLCVRRIQFLNLSSNLLEVLPAFEASCSSAIRTIDVSNNYISGTMPVEITYLISLRFLSVTRNRLYGTLPKLRKLVNLRALLLGRNQFTGSLQNVFGGTDQPDLLVVEVNNNHFSDALPQELFQLPSLLSLVAARNCFRGGLPDSICNQTKLRTVILDGLHASTECEDDRDVTGTIPGCILSLPHLRTLHLSGNNFVGNLPDNPLLSGNFTQLTVSHNNLYGKIPHALQSHAWILLDLSYNEFTGTLLRSFGEATLEGLPKFRRSNQSAALRIKNNRISGKIPTSLKHFKEINMLGTNMFACKADKSDIPDADDDKDQYQCASDAFDYTFYIFLGLGLTVVGIGATTSYFGRTREVAFYLSKWRLPKGSLPRSCQHVHTMVGILCQVALYTTVLIVLIFVPWYSIAGHYYGTYTHLYAYVVSAAFLSGFAPGITELFLQAALVLVVVAATAWITLITEKDERLYAERRSSALIRRFSQWDLPPQNVSVATRAGAYCVFLVINLSVVVGAYVAFIYVSLTSDSVWIVRVTGTVLSVLKFLWNTVCVPQLVYAIADYFNMPVRKSGGFFRVQTFIGLFNNIAIPCIVVAARSPSCFYNVLYPARSVVSNFFSPACGIVDGVPDCSRFSIVAQQTVYRPTFRYDYQCSSSFITYYAPSMITFALTPMIVVPLVYAAMFVIVRKTKATSTIHRFANAVLPALWKGVGPVIDPGTAPARSRTVYLDASNLLINMNIYLGIILTFGVAFPPIAVAMCAAMFSVAAQNKLAVGRLLCEAREAGRLDVVDDLERDCAQAASMEKLKSVIMTSIVFGCFFYVLFVFDTIGDDVGLEEAYWVLSVVTLVPITVYLFVRLRRAAAEQSGVVEELGYSMDGRVVEMTEMSGKDEDLPANGGGGNDGDGGGASMTLNALHSNADV